MLSASVVRERRKLRAAKRLFLLTLNKEFSVWVIDPKLKFLQNIHLQALSSSPTEDLVCGEINTTAVDFPLLRINRLRFHWFR